MGWKAGPDRFLMANRRWIPRWRFQPAANLPDALRLLETAAPAEYFIDRRADGLFRVRVRIGDAVGDACGLPEPLAITFAVARALGVEIQR
jgi:hypothetical protein